MGYLSAIVALIPLIKQLLDLWIKTPEEKRAQALEAFISFTAKVNDTVTKGAETGDYSDLQDVINRARHK